tara:strand:+ start:64 stop:426 length:363 start_codon:yes stop_codon:yes gene_type:complete
MFGGFWKKIFGKDSKSPVESFRDAYVSRDSYVSPLETKRKQVEMEKAGEMVLDQYRPDEHLPDSVVDAVVVEEKPKRARTKKGRYQADDKSTPDVNEAYVGGKAPKKKAIKVTRKKAKKK